MVSKEFSPYTPQELKVFKSSSMAMLGGQNSTILENAEVKQRVSVKRSVPVAGLDIEKALWSQGYHYIGGVDEAGRGPLAGPVVVANEFHLSCENVEECRQSTIQSSTHLAKEKH